MKIKKFCVVLFAAAFGFTSCNDILSDDEVTTADVVEGVKTALKIGTDSSAAELSAQDGYYGNPLIKIPLPEEVNTDLGEFVTGKALDGLFLKVGDQERAIRRDPFQWASDIIRKVFGSITTVLDTESTSTEQ